MAQDRAGTTSAIEAVSSTPDSQSAYSDLRRLIPSLASELEVLRTALREHSLWLLRYGHGNSQPAASTAQAAGQVPQPSRPPGITTDQPPSADDSQPPAVTLEGYIEPRVEPPSQPSLQQSSTAAQAPSASTELLPGYTGGFSTVSATTREEVSQRRDQLAEWLREGEDVLREYSARFAQLAEELGLPQEDLLGTWRDANPDNALPDYQMIEEREDLMVGGVGEVPPPYLRD